MFWALSALEGSEDCNSVGRLVSDFTCLMSSTPAFSSSMLGACILHRRSHR
ncbi:hypothetical protein JCM21142_72932 [Saccharicrinis fermentans DSM 9555 = JCM 21142]|uniref:Uncharacterized protein n=1 Tax=Saccharicrinis fermentans DSM 9555 = JCM 21142 TaxID=869213 RepID=W7XZZ2_9BACT|nr:hypothetical protein JCM21142_72932 [Saccharicrinis fermentans DSM 9555 = JCM 21142]